jgi:superfamily II DNA or RNA helicase
MLTAMARLEDLKAGASVRGLAPGGLAKVVQLEWFGDQAVKVTFEDSAAQVRNRLVFRTEEPSLEVVEEGRPWSFDGDGALLRLVSEAYRIRLAHLFDPYLAIYTSRIEPLPHQITAVYGEMLPRQPLRFLLADDPGAGKTIMAGLFIKELLIRGDLERCLIVAPGIVVEQWQDEMSSKFGLSFDILTRDQVEAARTGNPFGERALLIARLDMLSRNDDLKALLGAAREWDLVVCDEAHRMAASFFGGEVKYTKRYQLGQLLGSRCRHFLLMSATPHNGKEEDFQLFMALLDADRFEGRFRDGVHKSDVADMMRRLTKEELLKFDGRPLFPERRAYTAEYELSDAEAALYAAVTTYVREEMNRAERFAEGNEQRRINVGFALQILQRRLASSPAAIHESLRRRRERLEKRLAEARLVARGAAVDPAGGPSSSPEINIDPEDLEESTEEEIETAEETVLDQATAARTIAELEAEIATLQRLEAQARELRRSGLDRKWTELDAILDHPLMTDASGNRRKLIVFTEPRDTLAYLADKIRTRLGRHEAVVEIHGGIGREDRRKAVEAFMHDRSVLVMVANDAAGEGINLQRAHLMVNYDLPWNPNRLEQRFGRIHRIGQTEVCHLWNLVAANTREGEVYARLLEKLEAARHALGGRVYDVLGRLFQGTELRDLLVEAIRYGEQPEVKARLFEKVDAAVDQQRLLDLLAERALVRDHLSAAQVSDIRGAMERAEARRLQPHYIESFFLEAFRHLGGQIHRREPGRYEITRVPGAVRERDRQIGRLEPVLERYERACFDKDHTSGPPVAAYLCPGHPLLDAVVDLTLERYRDLMKRGAVLVDEADDGEDIRALFYLEHAVQDGRTGRGGNQLVVSQRLQFIEIDHAGAVRDGGPAPYLDYRPIRPEERGAVADRLSADWLTRNLEAAVMAHAVMHMVPAHVGEVRARRLPEIAKIEAEVQARLKREIVHWDNRAEDLRAQERAGKPAGRLNAGQAASRAQDLADRLERRLAELNRERDISALPPVIRGGSLVVPVGLLRALGAPEVPSPAELAETSAESRAAIERTAMEAVIAAERALGFEPRDVSEQNLGYDIESHHPQSGLRFIEVKGRFDGAETVTVTQNEIRCALNKPDSFVLAVVSVSDGFAHEPRYIRLPFRREPDFGVASVTYRIGDLLARATLPS